jgi:sugar lactone lactonase YvrE
MKNFHLGIRAVFFLFILTQACTKDNVTPSTKTSGSGRIQTIAGLGPGKDGYSGDGGPANLAAISWVTGIATDASNNVYITDGASNTVRKINASTKIITTVAGTSYPSTQNPYQGDGGLATLARLNVPLAVAIDAAGNMAIADAGNNVIRFVTAADGKISTAVGKGGNIDTYTGDGGLATQATIWNPYAVAMDAAGNIYIADSENNAIRKVTKATGVITTIAGLGPDQPGYSGDGGPATAAKINGPNGITIDTNGNVYFTDNGNHVIRKIANGIITTIAGTGGTGYSGDGGKAVQAKLSESIIGLTTDAAGNVYFVDSINNVIRKITASTGIITTVAGNGKAAYSGDGGDPLQASLSGPWGVAVDSNGNLYIADTQNGVIRMVTP